MFCHQDREETHRIAKPNIDAYFKSLVAAAEQDSGWGAGTSSRDYPGYDGHLDKLRAANFDSLLNSGTIWVGAPEDVRQQISGYAQEIGGFDTASLQVNFRLISASDAAASMRSPSHRRDRRGPGIRSDIAVPTSLRDRRRGRTAVRIRWLIVSDKPG